MYNIILFDLDGTLTDPKEGITKCVSFALKHFGIEENNLDRLEVFIGPPLMEQFMKYCGFDEEKAVEAVKIYREKYSREGIYQNRIYDGIYDMLKELKEEGFKLGVATSKPQVFADKILERFNIKDFFDAVVGSELDGRRSDKAEVIEEALSRLGVKNREKVLMVGDRKHDITGAKKCGVSSVGITFGYGSREELENSGADYVAENISQIMEFIKGK